jgi:hypothetical protein
VNQLSDENLVAGIQEDPIAQKLPERATYIPLRHADLRRRLCQAYHLTESEDAFFEQLCGRLQSIFHVEHLTVLLQLEEIYCHLDPDAELLDLEPPSAAELDWLSDNLIDRVSSLLYSAHYKRLSRLELERAIDIGWQWGVRLEVDFERFRSLEIFARGYRTVKLSRRRWQNFFRKETIELPEFQRLIMAFRTQPQKEKKGTFDETDEINPDCVYLKTFKNIPETDLEILLPGSKIRLTRLDKAKILLPTVSGTAITLYKLFRSVVVVSVAFTLSKIFGLIVLVGAGIGYIVKSVLGYFRTKTKYQFGLTRSLYLKNLDNNLGVIYRIVNEAEEQELCEAVLAYAVLWKHEPPTRSGFLSGQVDQIAERFLMETTGIDVDFEIHDGLGKLARLGLASVDSDGRWSVTPMDESLSSLDRNWRELLKRRTGIGATIEDRQD